MNRSIFALAALLAGSFLLEGRQDQLPCGTHSERWKEDVHLHHSNTRAFRAKFRSIAAVNRTLAAEAFALPDQGDIALLSDADGVVARRNAFNLQGRSVRFIRTENGNYRFETLDSTFHSDAASRGTLLTGLYDDDTRRIELPFPFPFYGVTYTSVYVNSDGNLTFRQGDGTSSERSLGRLTAGLPRIAGLFRDLDPSRSADGIRVMAEEDRFVVTWSEVPEFSNYAAGPAQTFQITLLPTGTIEIAFPSVTAESAIVGITPGESKIPSSIVSFANAGSSDYAGAIAERFTDSEQIDIFTAAQKFYLNHEDAYDYLVFYNALGLPAADGAVAYEVTVRNDRSGYGESTFDIGDEAGSPHRLQAILNMGPLSQYPKDPNARLWRATSDYTPLRVLGHEAGHLFLAYASVGDEDFPDLKPMLGRQGAHWAFTFNSEGSLLEGNRIQDNGRGAKPRFITTGATERYSLLDQYLMGFIPKEAVPDTFFVRNASTIAARAPQVGVGFEGQRQNVSIDDVIGAVGPRTPDHTLSQRHFRFAFVLIVPEDVEPTAYELEQIENMQRNFPAFFEDVSSARGHAEVTISRALRVSTSPSAELTAGAATTVKISLESPSDSPLELRITTDSGAVSAPESITIPAGETEVAFDLTAVREGNDEVVVTAVGGGYEISYSRLRVNSAAPPAPLSTSDQP